VPLAQSQIAILYNPIYPHSHGQLSDAQRAEFISCVDVVTEWNVEMGSEPLEDVLIRDIQTQRRHLEDHSALIWYSRDSIYRYLKDTLSHLQRVKGGFSELGTVGDLPILKRARVIEDSLVKRAVEVKPDEPVDVDKEENEKKKNEALDKYLNGLKDSFAFFMRIACGSVDIEMFHAFTEVDMNQSPKRGFHDYMKLLKSTYLAAIMRTSEWVAGFSRKNVTLEHIITYFKDSRNPVENTIFITSAELCGQCIRMSYAENPFRGLGTQFSIPVNQRRLNDILDSLKESLWTRFSIVPQSRPKAKPFYSVDFCKSWTH
jgi:hypothetical protein